ncbi:MAG: RNA 2',3'-cyclic phosphodiesterase [Bacillota bacterium]|nr:RNA 2',3'-cyclic phosphodiesterase [Bacillota bacterium]
MRLFIAVCFDDNVKDSLCETISTLNKHLAGGSATRRENLHLTLVFIGETTRAEAVKKAMNEIEACKFSLNIGGLGSFRQKDGRIYWIGVEKSDALLALYSRLKNSLCALGFKLESRPYEPHLTLFRRAVPGQGFDERSFVVKDIKTPVSKISLMKSERINGRLVYTEIYKKELS